MTVTISGDYAGVTPAVVDGAARPTADDLRIWLSIESTAPELVALLADAVTIATERIMSRCVPFVTDVDGTAVPTDLVPTVVGQAILMYAARTYRRRNSASGFEGFADIGFAWVSGIDPDIEGLIERWLAHDFA